MTDPEEILKLIETVSPDDTAKLDEIDARAWCFLNNYRYDGPDPESSGHFHYIKGTYRGRKAHHLIAAYSSSRDILKAIRPEGWNGYNMTLCGAFTKNRFWKCEISKSTKIVASVGSSTEELAELHAIIQAIAYERKEETV